MTTKTKIDTTPITGPRVKYWAGPIKASQKDGYHCDANLLNGGYTWFALNGRCVVVPETAIELMAADLSEFNEIVERLGYVDAVRHFMVLDKAGRGQRSVEEIKAVQEEEALMAPIPSYVDEVAHFANGLAETISDKRAEITEQSPEAAAILGTQPKNLAEALNWAYPGFEVALRDSSVGHKAVADQFPFTSESSVRRWRKANGVEVSK